jgi:hypothetical protein
LTFASNKEYYNLVDIIVDKNTYNKLESEIKRYASDIQSYLNNTKVVILPLKENSSSFDIASLNESLFFE